VEKRYFRVRKIELSLMECMSVFCVLVAVLLALVIGGILNLILDLLLCFMLIGKHAFFLFLIFSMVFVIGIDL
jgi:hypothetical protein